MAENDPDLDAGGILAAFDAPAFVRRGKQVEDAWTMLLDRCQFERRRLLELPRMRLGRLMALAVPRSLLEGLLPISEIERLGQLDREWDPHLRSVIQPARSARELVKPLADLAQSCERFNRRWSKYLNELELDSINQLRRDYNRFYLLEKECALFSSRVACDRFVPLKSITTADLIAQFPPLLIPSPRSGIRETQSR
jgi:hypothetical protein